MTSPVAGTGLPFTAIDWSAVPATEHRGAPGTATWRTLGVGETRVRMVDYSPGYVADHWCSRGHVILVITGELHTELESGEVVVLRAGDGYTVSNDTDAHRWSTETGARLFIVD